MNEEIALGPLPSPRRKPGPQVDPRWDPGFRRDDDAAPRLPPLASEAEKPVARDYSLVRAAPAPRTQEWDSAEAKSAGCVSCHTDSDQKTMHSSPAVVLGCVDCHGGNAAIVGDASLRPRRPALRRRPRQGARPAQISQILALAVERQPEAQLHPAQHREPGICPLRQSVRLSGRPRLLRRLPYRDDRGGRALAHGVGRDAVGRRRLQ